MAIIEKVASMKKEGKSEPEIIAALRAEGMSPMQISDAINQSKIKEAVSDQSPTQGMTPSIMGVDEDGKPVQQNAAPSPSQKKEENNTPPPQELYAPQPSSQPQPPQSMQQQQQQAQQNYSPQNYVPQNSQPPQAYQPQEQYYDQYSQQGSAPDPFAGYEQPQQDYYQPGGYDDYSQGYSDPGYGGSTDAMIEVAEQVFTEKMKKLSKEIRELTEFKTIFQTRVENISNRLERMEKYFDKMQLEILQKVSEYGKGMDYMKKELKMVEDSFGKLSKKF